jgi:hypothetical protein
MESEVRHASLPLVRIDLNYATTDEQHEQQVTPALIAFYHQEAQAYARA